MGMHVIQACFLFMFMFLRDSLNHSDQLFPGIPKLSVDFKQTNKSPKPKSTTKKTLLKSLTQAKPCHSAAASLQLVITPTPVSSAKAPVGIKGMLHLCCEFQCCGVTIKGWHKLFLIFLSKAKLNVDCFFWGKPSGVLTKAEGTNSVKSHRCLVLVLHALDFQSYLQFVHVTLFCRFLH